MDPSEAVGPDGGLERVRRWHRLVLSIGFCAAIGAPLAAIPMRGLGGGVSAAEQRRLREFPPWPANAGDFRRFARGFDDFYEDHLGLRSPLIRWHSRLSYFVFRVSPSRKVMIGRDGWLYYRGAADGMDGRPIDDYRGAHPLSITQMEMLRWAFQDQADWLREHGIRYLPVLIPSKEFMRPEHLPAYVTRVGRLQPREQFMAYARRHTDVPVLDLTPALEAGKPAARLYRRTDSHWDGYGAYLGYREIMNALAAEDRRLAPLPESAFERREERLTGGDLARMIGLKDALRDEYTSMTPRAPGRGGWKRLGDDDMADVMGGTGDPSLPSAIVYRDSFADVLIPFLPEHFNTVFFKWARFGTGMPELRRTRPDIVLQVIGDRGLRPGLRYSEEMQEWGARRRFEAAGGPVASYDAANGFAGLEALAEVRLRAEPGGLVCESLGRHPCLAVPDVPGRDRNLPILRLDVTMPDPAHLTVRWEREKPAYELGDIDARVSARLPKRRSEVYLPLVDPLARGPLRLGFTQPYAQPFTIHRVEIRCVPRWPGGFDAGEVGLPD